MRGCPAPLELDLRPKLHHPVRRQLEELRRTSCVLRHDRKEALAPDVHGQAPSFPGEIAREKELAPEVIARVERPSFHPLPTQELHHFLHVRRFHESVACHCPHEPGIEHFELHALIIAHFRDLLRDNREENHLLVQHLVVLEMMQEHHRRTARLGRHEH